MVVVDAPTSLSQAAIGPRDIDTQACGLIDEYGDKMHEYDPHSEGEME